jgi:hypothetical protein
MHLSFEELLHCVVWLSGITFIAIEVEACGNECCRI